MELRQYSLECRGLRLAVQESGSAGQPAILALHGWQDNSASLLPLAELLPDWRWIMPDLPGHGLSDWRGERESYYIWSYLDEVHALVQARELDQVILVGHSMGGAVAALYAAVYPERVSALVMLDMLGPLATPAAEAPDQLRRALDARTGLGTRSRRFYPDLAAACAARARRGLSLAAAELLASRGVANAEQGWYWRQDPRLNLANPLSMSEDLIAAFMGRVSCPTLLVAAPGYWSDQAHYQRRLGYFRQLEAHMLAGGHHQHMEAEAPQVAALTREFLQKVPAGG